MQHPKKSLLKKRTKNFLTVGVSWKGRRVFHTASVQDQKIFRDRQISVGRGPTRVFGKLWHNVLKSVTMGATTVGWISTLVDLTQLGRPQG